MIDPDAAFDFLQFVETRHRVWQRRQNDWSDIPWTHDRILATRKFTNVFRVLDYGTQFLIKELLDPDSDPVDVILRCFLYRHTNLPSAWEAMDSITGHPGVDNLGDWVSYMLAYRDAGNQIFSGAYMIYPQSSVKGTDKMGAISNLVVRLLQHGTFQEFVKLKSSEEQFMLLRSKKGVADFMAMQIVTDWGYSPHCGVDRENEFVAPGPGAKKGAAVLGLDPMDAIHWAHEAVHASTYCPTITLPDGTVRKPSLMDIQNCLCEFSKYSRLKPATTLYKPQHKPTEPVFPAHWSNS